MANNPQSPLPYTDTKPTGAADFYFAINATFRFILQQLGMAALREYWTELGRDYFSPVVARWKTEGLPGVADYWEAFFRAEPGAVVEVKREPRRVVLDVIRCPAIQHLRDSRREIVPCFCQHCYFVEEAMAAGAGLTVRIEGGNGRCTHTYHLIESAPPPQDLARIAEASC